MKWLCVIMACVAMCCACHREEPEPADVEIAIENGGQWDGVIEQ